LQVFKNAEAARLGYSVRQEGQKSAIPSEKYAAGSSELSDEMYMIAADFTECALRVHDRE
jgi:hypothetical protein